MMMMKTIMMMMTTQQQPEDHLQGRCYVVWFLVMENN